MRFMHIQISLLSAISHPWVAAQTNNLGKSILKILMQTKP